MRKFYWNKKIFNNVKKLSAAIYWTRNIINEFYIKEINKVYFLNYIKITIVIIKLKI